MGINLKAPETKSQLVAKEIEQQILSGNLPPNSRLPGMRTIAERFSCSLRVVQSAFEILDKRGIVECRLGSGTFVSSNVNIPQKSENDTIYFLIPHSIHSTLQLESSLIKRRMVYGASLAEKSTLVQSIAVSRFLENELENVDWDTVEQIPEGANVFICGFWFKKLFPFLIKRQAKVIIRSNQYQDIKNPDGIKYIDEGGWYKFVIDRIAAMEQAIQYFYNLGRRRIGVIKHNLNEPQHPYRIGMISGCKICGIEFEEALYHEINKGPVSEMEDNIVEFWKKTKCDSLVVGDSYLIKIVYNALTLKLGLRIPDDVALISFMDRIDYLDTEVPISAIDFPWVSMGREMVKCFHRKEFTPGEMIFQASIVERESTKKGAGYFVNYNSLPELPTDSHKHILHQMEVTL